MQKMVMTLLIVSLLIIPTILYCQQSQYYTGTGGSGMNLAILRPQSQNLTREQDYLPDVVQGVLVSIISKYSAINVMDRIAIDRVIADNMNQAVYRDGNFDVLWVGGLLQQRYVMTGNIIRTSTGFSLQLNVTDNNTARTIASHSGTYTLTELEDQRAGQSAARDLLGQMGVQLTAAATRELEANATQYQISAQVNLAQGLSAQRQGTEVAALSYFFQAAALDPSLLEAVSRSDVSVTNIRTGNIGADVRNDIKWRETWVERLRETEVFFYNLLNSAAPPYTLFYSTGIQQGNVDYQRRTVDMSIEANMRANSEWFSTVMSSMEKVTLAMLEGLISTDRASQWGLSNWPNTGVTNTNPYNRQWTHNLQVVFEVTNDRNRVIGSSTNNLSRQFSIARSGSQVYTSYSLDAFYTITFRAVNANDISDRLTIQIARINNAPPQNARLPIKPLSQTTFNSHKNALNHLRIENRVLRGFANNHQHNGRLTIPTSVWEEKIDWISAIGDRAFRDQGLTSIIIPNGVMSIGESAFANNRLTQVSLPEGLTSIGDRAFHNNQITNVRFPNSLRSIGNNAFSQTLQRQVWRNSGYATENYEACQLKIFTIGAGVRGVSNIFGFETDFYDKRGQGTYILEKTSWYHYPITDQQRARDNLTKYLQEQALKEAEQARQQQAKQDIEWKDKAKSRTVFLGCSMIFSLPPFEVVNEEGVAKKMPFFGFDLGGYWSFIPYLYIGAEGRYGIWQFRSKYKIKDSDGDGKPDEPIVNNQFYSFGPTLGFSFPAGNTKLFLGGLYEFSGTICSEFGNQNYRGAPGAELGINIRHRDRNEGGLVIRYRATIAEEIFINSIGVGFGF